MKKSGFLIIWEICHSPVIAFLRFILLAALLIMVFTMNVIAFSLPGKVDTYLHTSHLGAVDVLSLTPKEADFIENRMDLLLCGLYMDESVLFRDYFVHLGDVDEYEGCVEYCGKESGNYWGGIIAELMIEGEPFRYEDNFLHKVWVSDRIAQRYGWKACDRINLNGWSEETGDTIIEGSVVAGVYRYMRRDTGNTPDFLLPQGTYMELMHTDSFEISVCSRKAKDIRDDIAFLKENGFDLIYSGDQLQEIDSLIGFTHAVNLICVFCWGIVVVVLSSIIRLEASRRKMWHAILMTQGMSRGEIGQLIGGTVSFTAVCAAPFAYLVSYRTTKDLLAVIDELLGNITRGGDIKSAAVSLISLGIILGMILLISVLTSLSLKKEIIRMLKPVDE